ncbi:helix-turn-helix domain-containing protein [Pseudomonas sp. GCM10022188]|uniref:helix-turn-helix domain-containing protein n=1 Tax=Pseudomonas TaxID=286 RepID=UPI001E5492EF|nr:AraC family transcriptional regulator [Pseudomonas oryzagri]MCC6076075.1 AraC family transcriptional regulator [Pseudomonas oryzagri]
MLRSNEIQTRVLVSNSPSGKLRPFVDSIDIQASSHGAPWDDALAVEQVSLNPAEMEHCYISRTTIVQPLSSCHTNVTRLGDIGHSDKDLTKDVIHIDPSGSLTGARWSEALDVLFLMPSESMFERVLREMRNPPSKIELTRSSFVQDRQIQQIGLAILAECKSGFPTGRLFGESLAMALTARLINHYSTSQLNLPTSNHGLPTWRLRRVTDYIEENIGAELGLENLAAVAEFSEYHFSRMFKLRTGLTPHGYVTERRIARAKELLTRSQMSIKEISALLGFGDQAHMTTVFKRCTGTTPKKFREQAQYP